MSRGLRYRVIRKLAHGGMAEIFLADQVGAEGFEKPVVLKRILPALAADPGFVRMLVDEAHIASSLSHSHLVQVLDLGKAGDQYFLALEFVDGFSLEQIRLRARKARLKLPLPLALYIVSALCRGLDYVHRRTRNGKPLGIVHRDVTPQNLLIGREGDVKLADFGIAMARGRREKSATGVIKGKFAYMSPEQSIGAALDARSDLFSVGTLLYVLTTGKKPFEGTTDLDVLMQVRKARYEKPSNLVKDYNPDVERFIARALRADRARRWQSAEQMADRLDAILFKLGQPTGPAALKRWLETLTARDGIKPPGDVREAPQATSNETIQLASHELELQDVAAPPEEGEEDEPSVAGNALPTWKRAAGAAGPVAAVVPKEAVTTCLGTSPTLLAKSGEAPLPGLAAAFASVDEELDAALAAPLVLEPEYTPDDPAEDIVDDGPDDMAEHTFGDALAEYEFTLHNPLPGTGITFSGHSPADDELQVDVQTTVVVGVPAPSADAASTRVLGEPPDMVTLVDRAPALRAFEAALPAARTPEPAPPAVRAPEPALPAARPSRPPADPTLVMPAIAPRAPARPAAPAAPRLFTDEPVPPRRSEPEPPRPRAAPPPAEPDAPLDALPASLPLRLLRFTGRAAALLVLFTAAAGGGAYAARTYLPPWVARTEVVQRVDTWLQRVPALSELVR